MAKTTAKHFEIFKLECEKWIEVLGLKDWSVWYYHGGGLADCLASIKALVSSRVISIFLAKDWGDNEITEFQLKKTAFHEVSHILLVKLECLGKARTTFDSEIDEEAHSIIRTLENTLFVPRMNP